MFNFQSLTLPLTNHIAETFYAQEHDILNSKLLVWLLTRSVVTRVSFYRTHVRHSYA